MYLDHILATAKIPGMGKGKEGGKNQFKVINRLSSPEPLKQLWHEWANVFLSIKEVVVGLILDIYTKQDDPKIVICNMSLTDENNKQIHLKKSLLIKFFVPCAKKYLKNLNIWKSRESV